MPINLYEVLALAILGMLSGILESLTLRMEGKESERALRNVRSVSNRIRQFMPLGLI